MNDSSPDARKPTAWNDVKVEIIIGTLLRSGVITAAAVVLAGAGLYLVRHGHAPIDYSTFHGEPAKLRMPSDIIHDTLGGSGRAIIQLGLLLLIATPIARVAFSVVAFAIEHDYLYVLVTLIVLAVLLYSLLAST